MENIIENIKRDFNNRVSIKQKRPGIYQIFLPIYHEDGDMIDLFLTDKGGDNYLLGDYGLTLQKLSYSYDIDTSNKEMILDKIITENELTEKEGNIFLSTTPENIYSDIMHITQAYAKIGSMKYFGREIIESLFFESLDEFIMFDLKEYNPQRNVFPLPDRDDLQVDYQLTPNGHPVYLFGVKDVTKARLTTISCLEFIRNNLKYRSFIVHENFGGLPKKDVSRLTNSCDKQFTNLDSFKFEAKIFLEREKL